MTDWPRRYMELAQHVATWSKDPSTQVGAVLVGRDRREISLGYNGFPPGVEDTEERLRDRATKHLLTQHAERNALDNARFKTRGGLLVTTRFPCHECAKSIVSMGLYCVTCPPVDGDPAHSDPVWAQSSEWAKLILREGKVEVRELRL